jgi:Ca2+-binding EF-hand superfamily protein
MQPGNYSYQQFSNYSSSSKVQASSSATQNPTGYLDREAARNLARRIMDTYDRDRNGVIDNIEVVTMIIDTYKSFNKVFSPARADIEGYLKVLDFNSDGKVTLPDLEALCERLLGVRI